MSSPSSIWQRDSISRPLNHESSPITTRPGPICYTHKIFLHHLGTLFLLYGNAESPSSVEFLQPATGTCGVISKHVTRWLDSIFGIYKKGNNQSRFNILPKSKLTLKSAKDFKNYLNLVTLSLGK